MERHADFYEVGMPLLCLVHEVASGGAVSRILFYIGHLTSCAQPF